MSRHCYVLRVFTRGNEGGNHLGVVTDRSGLPPAKMQEIAAELGYPETVFLDWRERENPKVRIFTPTVELPFAGHPLVGITRVLHMLGPGGPTQIECGIGPIQIGLDGESAWVAAPLNQMVTLDVGLPDGYDPGSAVLSTARADMPIAYHVVEMVDSAAVSAAPLAPDGMVVVFVRTSPHTAHVRFFAPFAGIPEDPATGSAPVGLAAVLRARGETEGSLTISQGDEMGAPSTIHLSWDDHGARIGGTVVKDETMWLDH